MGKSLLSAYLVKRTEWLLLCENGRELEWNTPCNGRLMEWKRELLMTPTVHVVQAFACALHVF